MLGRIVTRACIVSFMLVTLQPAVAQDWVALSSPDLVNQWSGPDRLWGTADDTLDLGGGLGSNTIGSSFIWNSPFGSPIAPVFMDGSISLNNAVVPGAGTYLQTAFSSSGEMLGVGPIILDVPSFAFPSVLDVAADQSLTFEQFWGGPGLEYKTISTGFVIFPGDDINSLIADVDVANHVSFLVGLLPGGWETAMYLDGEFLDLMDAPNGLGPFSGVFYTAPVPLPAPIVLLGSALLGLLRYRSKR